MRVFAFIVHTFLVTAIIARAVADQRIKREHADTALNALLNIYKMNPLKRSKVYEKFSKQLLSCRPDTRRNALNIDSNESTRYKEKRTGAKLRRIESIIRKSQKRTTADFRSFVVDSSTPENFMQSSIINDFLKIKFYNTDDKIAEGKIKILVNNVDGKLVSDMILHDVHSIEQKKNDGEQFETLNDALRVIDENKSDYRNVIVLR